MDDYKYLSDILEYDENGTLFWLSTGEEVSSNPNKNGYKHFRIEGKLWEDHRIVWILHNKQDIPKGMEVDHEDTNKLNNKPDNLRLATRSQNCWNRNNYVSNTTGVKGVGWHKGQLRGRIQVHGKQIHVGYFKSLEEAREAMWNIRYKLHKDFARHEHVDSE